VVKEAALLTATAGPETQALVTKLEKVSGCSITDLGGVRRGLARVGRHRACSMPAAGMQDEEAPPAVDIAIEEARRLREESLRIRQGLGPVVDGLAAQRAAARRAARAIRDVLGPQVPREQNDD
jgi:hypothetical protein